MGSGREFLLLSPMEDCVNDGRGYGIKIGMLEDTIVARTVNTIGRDAGGGWEEGCSLAMARASKTTNIV